MDLRPSKLDRKGGTVRRFHACMHVYVEACAVKYDTGCYFRLLIFMTDRTYEIWLLTISMSWWSWPSNTSRQHMHQLKVWFQTWRAENAIITSHILNLNWRFRKQIHHMGWQCTSRTSQRRNSLVDWFEEIFSFEPRLESDFEVWIMQSCNIGYIHDNHSLRFIGDDSAWCWLGE